MESRIRWTCYAISAAGADATGPVDIIGVSIIASHGNCICFGNLSFTFTAIPVNGGTSPVYQWKVNGANVGTNSNTYTTSTLLPGDQVWCELTSNAAYVSGNPAVSNIIVIAVSPPPTVANAGFDQSICAGSTKLSANTPTVGTGLWSVVSGIATITNPSSPISTVTGLAYPGTVTLRWTISNPPCPDSYDDVVITTTQSCIVGSSKEGGVVFYNGNAVGSCYVSATSNQSTLAPWGCGGTYISTGTAIGTGANNTTNIVNGCLTSGIAARICDEFVLNGYSDWFLPSKDELNQMYNQRNTIGGFTSNYYWSSTQSSSTYAYYQNFSSGSQSTADKDYGYYVRCIRRY